MTRSTIGTSSNSSVSSGPTQSIRALVLRPALESASEAGPGVGPEPSRAADRGLHRGRTVAANGVGGLGELPRE
eukprot:6802604-Alexandrium_andersonii.AAC.1